MRPSNGEASRHLGGGLTAAIDLLQGGEGWLAPPHVVRGFSMDLTKQP